MISRLPLPECEAQIRPLVGLPAEAALQFWMKALEWTGTTAMPARIVKRAVRQVVKAEPLAVVVKPAVTRQQRYETRQAIKKEFAD